MHIMLHSEIVLSNNTSAGVSVSVHVERQYHRSGFGVIWAEFSIIPFIQNLWCYVFAYYGSNGK